MTRGPQRPGIMFLNNPQTPSGIYGTHWPRTPGIRVTFDGLQASIVSEQKRESECVRLCVCVSARASVCLDGHTRVCKLACEHASMFMPVLKRKRSDRHVTTLISASCTSSAPFSLVSLFFPSDERVKIIKATNYQGLEVLPLVVMASRWQQG